MAFFSFIKKTVCRYNELQIERQAFYVHTCLIKTLITKNYLSKKATLLPTQSLSLL